MFDFNPPQIRMTARVKQKNQIRHRTAVAIQCTDLAKKLIMTCGNLLILVQVDTLECNHSQVIVDTFQIFLNRQ